VNLMAFWYLATPYTKYPKGIDEAFKEASRQAALLVGAGIPVFCPIAHAHPIAIEGGLDPFDHTIWLPADRPFMDAARGLIVCKMLMWEFSRGVIEEIRVFTEASKPIIYMEPDIVPALLLRRVPRIP
jgi:hypothetical protein